MRIVVKITADTHGGLISCPGSCRTRYRNVFILILGSSSFPAGCKHALFPSRNAGSLYKPQMLCGCNPASQMAQLRSAGSPLPGASLLPLHKLQTRLGVGYPVILGGGRQGAVGSGQQSPGGHRPGKEAFSPAGAALTPARPPAQPQPRREPLRTASNLLSGKFPCRAVHHKDRRGSHSRGFYVCAPSGWEMGENTFSLRRGLEIKDQVRFS